MAHGKETPRQKMIGMMYLVLTALLALNVRKDVLDAFVLVDEGLTKTTENFVYKNDMLYNDFKKAAAENKVKAAKWLQKALVVQNDAQHLVNQIEDLKREIITKAEKGKVEEIYTEEGFEAINVKAKDNYDIPAEIMIGPNMDQKGFQLKNEIIRFRETLIDMIENKERYANVVSSIEENLNTDDPPKIAGNEGEKWETEHFQHLPLIAVITLMSKMQSDIRNAESDILKFLYEQIDAGSFTFNKLEPTVIPTSNYIISGNEYFAEVFIAASDTTKDPVILIGPYDSVEVSDGVWDYVPVKDYKYDTLPVNPRTKKGEYLFKPTSSGRWGGLIELTSPSGGVTREKFERSYQVVQASLTVSPTKMNMFYRGVDNPVDIAVPGVTSDKVFPSISNGRISRRGSGYIVHPGKGAKSVISVSAEVDGKRRVMGSKEFRVENVPDPYPTVKGIKRGMSNAQINTLTKSGASIIATMPPGFAFDINFRITGFEMAYNMRGLTYRKNAKGSKLTSDMQNAIGNLSRGDMLVFRNIEAVGPDGSVRNLGTLSYTLR